MAFRPLLLACLWLAALPAIGQGVEFVQPSAGSTLKAGDEVVVRWSAAPAKAKEMELLLSVDGGRHFAVRLTHELAGNASTFHWRVPRLPAGAVRLGLRANLGGREVEVGSSAPFAITDGAESAGPAGSIELLHGELWWMERAVAGSEGDRIALAGLDAPPAEPRVLPSAGESMLADLRSPAYPPRHAVASIYITTLLAASSRPALPRPAARTPLLSPLRI